MRLLILLGLAYLGYRAVKSWVLPGTDSTRETVSGQTAGQIDDVMVKDPFCEVYFPKRNGVHLRIKGEDLYFCSEECKNRYLEMHSK